MNDCFELLICPICREPLRQVASVLKCERNHSFDIAKEGYVNLLPSRKKLAATVGDDAKMLQARRRFLDAGHYAALSEAINNQVTTLLQTHFEQGKQPAILDAGCGEGYYLGQLHTHLLAAFPMNNLCLLGMDVSKTAVRYAAKRVKNGRFFVANTNTLIPAGDQTVNVLLNIFAPRNPAEFARVMTKNGHLLIVIPKPTHLQSIRAEFDLLAIETDKKEHVVDRLSGLFQLVRIIGIEDKITLTSHSLTDLLQMTPNAHHLSEAQWHAVRQSATRTTQIGFDVMHFVRNKEI